MLPNPIHPQVIPTLFETSTNIITLIFYTSPSPSLPEASSPPTSVARASKCRPSSP